MAWVAEGSDRVGKFRRQISTRSGPTPLHRRPLIDNGVGFLRSAFLQAGYVILPVKSMLFNMPLILEVIPHTEDQVMRIIGRICIRERVRRGVKAETRVIKFPLAK